MLSLYKMYKTSVSKDIHFTKIKNSTITVSLLLDRNLVTCLSVSMDGTLLLSGSNDETVRMWDVQSKQCIWSINHKGKHQALSSSLYDSLVYILDLLYVQSPLKYPSILQCSARLADSSFLSGSLTSLPVADVPLDTCVFFSLGVWSLVFRPWLAGSSAGMMRFCSDSDTACSVLVLIREHILSAPLWFDSSSSSKEDKTTSFSCSGSPG